MRARLEGSPHDVNRLDLTRAHLMISIPNGYRPLQTANGLTLVSSLFQATIVGTARDPECTDRGKH
jgi:hypothetical protein